MGISDYGGHMSTKYKAAQPQNVSGIEFSSKKELQQFARNLMKLLGPQEFESGPIFNFFVGMVQRHPDAEKKLGSGIKKIIISPNKIQPKYMEFVLLRTDGTYEDISYKKCSTGIKTNDRANLIQAMRWAIDDQISSFKASTVDILAVCYMCGCDLKSENVDIHVDHVTTFKELSEGFLSDYKGVIPTEFDDHAKSNAAIFRKEDSEFEQAWTKYHKDNADLELACSKCNLKRNAKE